MRFPKLRLLFLVLLLCPGQPAAALDLRRLDILGLRLGMSLSGVLACLGQQGIARSRLRVETGSCGQGRCTRLVAAPTHDGTLLVRFAARAGPGSESVWSIAYNFAGRGAGEPEMIRAAVLDRFGPPTSSDPLTWCAMGSSTGCDPPNQPRLTFVEGPETSSTLTLSDAMAAADPRTSTAPSP